MKRLFIVNFVRKGTDHVVSDSVFKNREDAQDYVNQWNNWEESEDGQGDFWFFTESEFYETRVEI